MGGKTEIVVMMICAGSCIYAIAPSFQDIMLANSWLKECNTVGI